MLDEDTLHNHKARPQILPQARGSAGVPSPSGRHSEDLDLDHPCEEGW